MPTPGFHSEWATVAGNRVLIESRYGFPQDEDLIIAAIAVTALRVHSPDDCVLRVFYDGKSCTYAVTIGTDDPDGLQETVDAVEAAINGITCGPFGFRHVALTAVVAPPGNRDHDNYHHAHHLAKAAGLIGG